MIPNVLQKRQIQMEIPTMYPYNIEKNNSKQNDEDSCSKSSKVKLFEYAQEHAMLACQATSMKVLMEEYGFDGHNKRKDVM